MAMAVSDLAQHLNVAPPTASNLVNTLADKGWIHVAINPRDHRRRQIELTQAGQDLLKNLHQKRLNILNRVVSRLDPQERLQLVSVLERLVDAWQTSLEGSSPNGY